MSIHRAAEEQTLKMSCATGVCQLRSVGSSVIDLGCLMLLRFTVLRPCTDGFEDAPQGLLLKEDS